MSNVVRSAAVRLTLENSGYIRGADQSAAATERATGRMQRAVRTTTVSTGRDWDTMGKYGGRTALAIGAGLGYAEKKLLSFDKTMSTVTAVTEANAATQAKLRAAAIKAGADTAFTATEAAQAIAEEGKAGLTTANILKGGLRGALNLAAAGSIGVAEAAEDMSTALVQFHLDGGQATHVADLLAAASNKAQGEVGDMSLALSYIGVPAHAAKVSLEETVGTIALLAKNGLIGEKAGTSLRGMLASLQSPSKLAQKVMKDLGIEVFDSTGKFKGFDGVAQVLHDRLGGLTDQERQYALGKIFGNEQLQAANILYEEGAKGVRKMTREVNDQGYASEVANKKLDNLAGDWEKFTGSLESAIIGAGSPAQGALRDIVQTAEGIVHTFAGLPDEVQAGIVKMTVLAGVVGGILYAVSKVRNITRDLRGVGRAGGRGAAGGLGGVASLAAPVPVYVVNLGPGGLGGLGGKAGKGGPVILGGGAAAEKGILGRLRGFRLPPGTGIVATLGGLALIATGATDKTHSGSTVGGAVAGGSFLGVPGAIGGGILGAGVDIYHAGGSTKNAIDAAQAALDSGRVKDIQAALADLNEQTEKLAYGGWGQNFNRAVTVLTGRDSDIKDTQRALQEALDEHKYNGNMLWLVSGGRMGKAPKNRAGNPLDVGPVAKSLDDLLDPKRGAGRKKPAKERTSKEVLADFYGIDTRKLKPVDLFAQITGLANDVWPGLGQHPPTPGGKSQKNGIGAFTAAIGLDTSEFDKKAGGSKKTLDELGRTRAVPKLEVGGNADATLGAFLARWNALHDKSITLSVHQQYFGSQVAKNKAQLADIHGADGMTIPGARYPYGDKVYIKAAPGEELITNRRGEADQFRRDRAAGRIPAYANGGTVAASPIVSRSMQSLIDYNRLAAAVTGNQLLGHRGTRDALEAALRSVLREMPVQRVPADFMYGIS